MWGDEVEYNVLNLKDGTKEAKVSLRAKELLEQLQVAENSGKKDLASLWRPEYASYMVEGTPGTYDVESTIMLDALRYCLFLF